MPNWCDNSLRISNQDKDKIDALEKVLTEKGEIFQSLRPRPASEEDNWYDWNINNWGTKWDISTIDWERQDEHTIWISFESAWAPPTALYEYLDSEGWEIEGYYNEGGCAFCGKWTSESGDEYYEYDFTDRESLEAIPSDIDDFTGLLDYHDSCKADGEFDEEEVG